MTSSEPRRVTQNDVEYSLEQYFHEDHIDPSHRTKQFEQQRIHPSDRTIFPPQQESIRFRKEKSLFTTIVPPQIPSFALTEEEKKALKDDNIFDVEIIDTKFRSIESAMRRIVKYASKPLYNMSTLIDCLSGLEGEMREMKKIIVLKKENVEIRQVHQTVQGEVENMNRTVNYVERKFSKLVSKQNSRICFGFEQKYRNIVHKMIERDFRMNIDFGPFSLTEETEHFLPPQESYDNLSDEFKELFHFLKKPEPYNKVTDRRFWIISSFQKIKFPSISIDEEGRITIFRFSTNRLCYVYLDYKRKNFARQWTKNLFYEISMLELQASSIKDYDKIGCVVFVYELIFGNRGRSRYRYSQCHVRTFIQRYPLEFKNLNRLIKDQKFFSYHVLWLDRAVLYMK